MKHCESQGKKIELFMLMRLLKDVSKGSSQPAPTYIISFLKFSALSLNDNRTKYLCNNNASVHILQAKCLPDSIIILLVIISGISYPILIYPRLFVHSLSFLATHSGNNHCISFIAGPIWRLQTAGWQPAKNQGVDGRQIQSPGTGPLQRYSHTATV